jgi:hypothetical protein
MRIHGKIGIADRQLHCKQRTALRSVHIDHCVLHWVQFIALDGTDTFNRRHMASIGGEHGHQTTVDRKVPNVVDVIEQKKKCSREKKSYDSLPENTKNTPDSSNSKEASRVGFYDDD